MSVDDDSRQAAARLVRERRVRAREPMPLTGIRLWRWKAALRLYRLGCIVSGRHEALLEYDEAWKVYYCPHCGWVSEDEQP